MAKRSIERTLTDFALSGVGIGLIAFALLVMLLREYPLQLLVLCIMAFTARHYWKNWKQEKRRAELECASRSADAQIEHHRGALIAYYRQSVRLDQFGNEDARVWEKWIRTFVDTQVRPKLEAARLQLDDGLSLHVAAHVDQRVREIAKFEQSGSTAAFASEKLDPLQYEQSCAAILFRRGWSVHPTPTTGDHGADVIAEKGEARLVVQCKLYAQPVGNKAVQEVFAACRLYDGTHACVIAPNGFTAHAERAANGLSVRLLHHSQLEAFADELGSAPSRRGIA